MKSQKLKKDINKLDKYYPPCGPCMFCGHHDKRHRLWDTWMDMNLGGDTPELIAEMWEEPVKYIKLVLELRPYENE